VASLMTSIALITVKQAMSPSNNSSSGLSGSKALNLVHHRQDVLKKVEVISAGKSAGKSAGQQTETTS